MKKIVLLFHFLLFTFCFNLFGTYTVDLSSPPENRWVKLVNQYDKEEIRQYAGMIQQAMLDVSGIFNYTWTKKSIMEYGWYTSLSTDSAWFEDLRAEIKGLADAIQDRMDGESLVGLREEDLFLLNVGYDFSTYCTSGVFQTPQGPILFRNLDWLGDDYRKFTTVVEFIKDGELHFKSIHFLGLVGVFTGMKPNQYAVSLNFRKTPGTGSTGWQLIHNINQYVFKDGWTSAILLRYTLDHELDFEGARSRLESTELMAPCYYILAGTHKDEGVIMERGRNSVYVRDFQDPLENPKFLVQSNHDIPLPSDQDDRWAGDDILLNESLGMGTISRRDVAVEFLKTVDESNIETELMKMLTEQTPVFNPCTIFSSIMIPIENKMELKVHKKTGSN